MTLGPTANGPESSRDFRHRGKRGGEQTATTDVFYCGSRATSPSTDENRFAIRRTKHERDAAAEQRRRFGCPRVRRDLAARKYEIAGD